MFGSQKILKENVIREWFYHVWFYYKKYKRMLNMI